MREVRDRGGDDVAAPGILDRHGNAEFDAKVAGEPRLRESAELADLQVDDVHRAIGGRANQRRYIVDDFIEHEGMVAVCPHREAFFVRGAGLFDAHVEIAHAVHDAKRVVLQPARVGIRDQAIAALELRRHRANAFDIELRVIAHLELESRVALGAIGRDAGGHLFRLILRDRAIQRDCLAEAAAEQGAHRHAGGLAENVPAGDIERRFHVGVALESRIHQRVERTELRRIGAEQMRGELGQP